MPVELFTEKYVGEHSQLCIQLNHSKFSLIPVITKEIIVEINPIQSVDLLVDLSQFSSFVKSCRVMKLVLSFIHNNNNPLVA